jgi:hypothetical protein
MAWNQDILIDYAISRRGDDACSCCAGLDTRRMLYIQRDILYNVFTVPFGSVIDEAEDTRSGSPFRVS